MAAGGRVRYLKHTALGLLGSREDEMVALWPLADLPTALAGGGEVNQTLCECLLGPLGGRGLILKSSPITNTNDAMPISPKNVEKPSFQPTIRKSSGTKT